MNVTDEAYVLYRGINGFGVTWSYFCMNLAGLFIALVGVILNALIFYVTRQKNYCNDVSEIFIHNLAASDAINACICIYVLFYNLIHFKNYFECALRYGLVCGVHLNSAIHLLFLTLDRYVKILFPFRYVLIFQESAAKVCSGGSWTFCIVLSILPLAGWRNPSPYGLFYCSFFGVMTKTFLIFISTLFTVTFSIIFVCYMTIVCVAWRKRQQTMNAPTSVNSRALWWKPTKTVLTLITLYFLCWVPSGLFIVLHTGGFLSHMSNEEKGTTFAYLAVFIFINTIGNPVVFAMKSTIVRNRLKRLLAVHIPALLKKDYRKARHVSHVYTVNNVTLTGMVPNERSK